MYSTLEKYTFDRRKTVGGEPVIERFGLTKSRKKTRSNSRKDSRHKRSKRSRSKSKRASRSPRKSSGDRKTADKMNEKAPPVKDSGNNTRPPKIDKSEVQPSSVDSANRYNTQRVDVSIDRDVDDGYSCGGGYWNDGYLGPGGFICRYPPPWNYMDTINPGFYYPDPAQYLLPGYGDEIPVVARNSAPITNNIKVLSDNKHSPSPKADVLHTADSPTAELSTNVSNEQFPEHTKKDFETRPKECKYRTDRGLSERGENDVAADDHDSTTEQQGESDEDTEKFPTEPVKCGSNSTGITVVIILGVIVLVAVVIAFIFVGRGRRG